MDPVSVAGSVEHSGGLICLISSSGTVQCEPDKDDSNLVGTSFWPLGLTKRKSGVLLQAGRITRHGSSFPEKVINSMQMIRGIFFFTH